MTPARLADFASVEVCAEAVATSSNKAKARASEFFICKSPLDGNGELLVVAGFAFERECNLCRIFIGHADRLANFLEASGRGVWGIADQTVAEADFVIAGHQVFKNETPASIAVCLVVILRVGVAYPSRRDDKLNACGKRAVGNPQ